MPKINVLPKEVAELIAAGEVVERPASVIKELVENAIDSGADKITVEIQHGGITYMRVTDNGCGIAPDDVKMAFLRHATSKLKVETDLDSIATLGFRGEALAAISAVSRVEMLTALEDKTGVCYVIAGGEEVSFSEAGCPKGTTITVKDLFYNTPARMKFLKKDVTEANAVASVIERIALSHPEISFRFIREGKTVLTSSGDGKLKSAVYSILGREYASSLIEVNGDYDGIKVEGLVCKPVFCKGSRSGQYFFLNGRLVRSLTVMSAVEQAYKNSVMVGKYPACVICIGMPFSTVDVNVHPAKTEVRFSDERKVFDAVYFAVKNALSQKDTRPDITFSKPKYSSFEHLTSEKYRQEVIKETVRENPTPLEEIYFKKSEPVLRENKPQDYINYGIDKKNEPIKTVPDEELPKKEDVPSVQIPEVPKTETSVVPELSFIGEAFKTYIIVEKQDSVFFIDKHAAHERIIFERLKSEQKTEVQLLLSPVNVRLSPDEYDAIISNTKLLDKSGFEIEDFGNSTVLVRSVPVLLRDENIQSVISEIASGLTKTGNVEIERLEDIYHTVACKSAIKAGFRSGKDELLKMAERILSDNSIMYCPHGRPVAFELKRKDIEKRFGRIQ